MSAYGIQLLERSVNDDMESKMTENLDTTNLTYSIETFIISVVDDKDTLKYSYEDISVIPKKTRQNKRTLLIYTGNIPENGVVEVELQRLFNELSEKVRFNYTLKDRKIK